MENIIHVHDVLALLESQKEAITKEELKKLLEEKYNLDLQFKTCNIGEYGFDDIIIFMQERNKVIIGDDGKISFNKCGSCQGK